MLGDINYLLKPHTPQLFLAKPNKRIIGKLKEAYEINQEFSLTKVSELSFKIPYELDINNQLVRNKNVDIIRERYYVQVKLGNKSEWYVIHEINEDMDDEGDAKEIKCYALPIELGDKNIRGYSEESLNAREVLTDILSKTIWTIGLLDADFELTYRTFEFNDTSILDAVYQVAETYNAIVEWDTENRTISLIKPELHGVNKGLTFSLGKYLKTMNRQSVADEMVTSLIPVGADGLTISGINPTGRNLIQDFSFFTYPFERDNNRKVIQSSDYMSDELCHALFDFKEKFASYEDSYAQLVSQLTGFKTTLATKNSELANLDIAMSSIQSIQLSQQLDGVMFFEKFQYSGSATTINYNDDVYKFDDLYQYAVLCKVSNRNNINITLNGTSTLLIAGSWVLLGKVAAGNVPVISVSGTGNAEVFIQVININSEEYSTSNNAATLIEKYNYDNKQMQIDEKKAEIAIVQAQISTVEKQIDTIQDNLAAENNFTLSQLAELNLYIIEKVFEDSKYIEDTDLYKAAKEKFKELQTPQVSIDIDIVNFLEIIEEQRNWDKLKLGDKVILKYEKFNLKVEAKIISLNFDYEEGNVKLTIANIKDISDSRKKMEQYLYNTKNNTSVLSSNATKWTQAVVDSSDMSQLFENFWDKTTNEINMASNEYVTYDRKGLTIIDPNDPLRFLRATHGVLGLTRSGGLRYETAISADGLIAEMVLGKLILGQRVTIGTADGVWLTEGPLTTITDRHDRVAMLLGLYEENPDKFGIVVNRYADADGSSSRIINKIIMNSEEGFKIQQFNGLVFKDKFYVDAEGLLYAEDITTKRLTIVNETDQIILDSYTKYMDISKFDSITTDGVLTALEKLTVKGEQERIISEYTKLLAQAEAYATTSRDGTIRIDPTNFTKSYNALMAYLNTLLADMDATSFIDRDEFNAKFKAYYDEVVNIINAINDSIKYSSLQLGSFYNKLVLDALDGLMVTRSDDLFRVWVNATNGIAIEKNQNGQWVKKFYVNAQDGRLWAEELVAKKLQIVSGLDEVLLDAESKHLNIGVFTEIIADGKLTAIEKLTLKQEWETIQTDYAKILSQANQYKTAIRDGNTTVLVDIPPFTNAFNNLSAYVTPLLADMSATTTIDRSVFTTKFQTYYDQAQRVINEITNALKWSSVQLGQTYNNTVIDQLNGVTSTRGDNLYRANMSGTNGFMIERNTATLPSENWEKVFWADLNGIVHAKGLDIEDSFVTGGGIEGAYIILRDGLGGVMKLYPSQGFWAGAENASSAPALIQPDGTASFSKLIVKDKDNKLLIDGENRYIDMSGFDLIGGGAIYSELLSATIVTSEYGFISDLTSARLSTLSNAATAGWSNYIVIEGNDATWRTGRTAGSGTQTTLSDGRPLYWVSSSKTGQMTTEETAWPVMTYPPMDDKIKMVQNFNGEGDAAYPQIIMGLGDGGVKDGSKINDGLDTENSTNVSGRAIMTKPAGSFVTAYYSGNYGKERSIDLRDDGIVINSEENAIRTIAKIYQFAIEEGGSFSMQHANGCKLIFDTSGNISLEAANNLNLKAAGAVNVSGTSYNFT